MIVSDSARFSVRSLVSDSWRDEPHRRFFPSVVIDMMDVHDVTYSALYTVCMPVACVPHALMHLCRSKEVGTLARRSPWTAWGSTRCVSRARWMSAS